MADRTIKSILRFIADKASVDRTERDIGRIEKALDEQRAAAERTQQAFTSLEDVSVRIGAAGAAVLAPLTLAANKYASEMDGATESSRRWLKATERTEAANLELGRKAAEALLPYKELVADILERISNVDPRLLEAGVAVGSGLALVGAAGLIAAQIGRFAAMVQILGTHIKALAASQRGQRLGVGVAAVTAGVAGGIGIVRGIGNATGDKRLQQYGLSDVVKTLRDAIGIIGALFIAASKQLALVFAQIERQWNIGREKVGNFLQKLSDTIESFILNLLKTLGEFKIDLGSIKGLDLGDLDIGDKLGIDVGKINDRLDEIGQHGSDASERLAEIDRNYQQRLENIDANTADVTEGWLRFLGIVKDEQEELTAEAEKRRAAELQHQRDQLDLFESFFSDQSAAQMDFQADSEESLRQHQQARADIEQAYQRQQERQLEDHERSLAERRDKFAKQQAEQVKDYQKRIQDIQQAFANDQKTAQKAFQVQRNDLIDQQQKDDLKRLQDFNLKRQREEEDHNQRLLEAAGRRDGIAILNELRNFNKQKSRSEQDFDRESQQRKEQADQRVADEKAAFEAEQAERAANLQQRLADERAAFMERQRLAQENFNDSERQQKEQFQRQQARQQEDHERALADMELQFIEEQRQARLAFDEIQTLRQEDYNRQLRALNDYFADEEAATNAHYNRLKTQQDIYNAVILQNSQNLTNALRNTAAASFLSGSSRRRATASVSAQDQIHNPAARRTRDNRAAGGYMDSDYFNHGAGREFAMSRDTTSMLERAMGTLSQSKLQNMVNSRSQSIGSLTLQVGDIGNKSPQQIEKMIFNGVIKAFDMLGE